MRRVQRAWAFFQRYKMEIYDRPGERSRLKVWLLKAKVIETILYGCTTWTLNKPDYDMLRRLHHSKLLRCLGWRKRKRDGHTFSFFFPLTLLLSSFWTSRGHRCRPFSQPVLAFNFYRA